MPADKVRNVALATSRHGLAVDDDMPLLVDAFAALNVTAAPMVWDAPVVDWSTFDAVLIRSVWDYIDRRADFLEWARQVERTTPVFNPSSVLEWNTDKKYLLEVEAASVLTVPTQWWDRGEAVVLPTTYDFVIKPSISAGGRDISAYAAGDDAAMAHVARIFSMGRGYVMVQPRLDELSDVGETDVVFIDGVFTHAVQKLVAPFDDDAAPDGFSADKKVAPASPTPRQLEVAQGAIDAVSKTRRLLYARVDLVDSQDNGPLVLEIEATEPALFLPHCPAAADRLARATLMALSSRHA